MLKASWFIDDDATELDLKSIKTTPKKTRARWNRKDCLRWLLDFAARPLEAFYRITPNSPLAEAQSAEDGFAEIPAHKIPVMEPAPATVAEIRIGIEHFLNIARVRPGGRDHTLLTPAQISGLYSRVRHGINEISRHGTWDVKMTDLKSAGIAAGAGWLDYDGDTHDQFLLACLDLMRSHGKLISTCAREGCNVRFVKERRARYCGESCSRIAEAQQARKRRETSPTEARREQRRRYYLNYLKKHDHSRWKHIVAAERAEKTKSAGKTRER